MSLDLYTKFKNGLSLESPMDGKRKRVFFAPFLFIGIGVGALLIDPLGGNAFVASMFIGMGIGFILDSFFSVEKHEIRVQTPVRLGSFAMMIVGALFIIGGLSAIISPQMLSKLMPYLIGMGFILGGVFMLISGFRMSRSDVNRVK
jgi:uncharacterized membrane protein HdeD (DUF308 family)